MRERNTAIMLTPLLTVAMELSMTAIAKAEWRNIILPDYPPMNTINFAWRVNIQ